MAGMLDCTRLHHPSHPASYGRFILWKCSQGY